MDLDSLTVTDSDGQQLATVEEGELIEPDREAMKRAADYVLSRGFKAATSDLIAYIATHAVDTSDLNVVILEQMAVRLLNAESPDDILDPFGTLKGTDMLGKSLQVTSVQFLEGEYADGFPWYVSLSCYDAMTKTTTPVTVGGEKLVLQVAALDMKGAWPMIIAIRKATKPTKAGFYPLEIGRP